MPQQRIFVDYDSFLGGESGTLSRGEVPSNSFHGTNVIPSIDGGIMPRCGLLDITPTGQSNGAIAYVGAVNKDLDADFFYVQGTHVYQWQVGGARSAAYTGSFASAPTENCVAVSVNVDRIHYILVPNDKVYKVDHDAMTITALSSSPNGRTMALYGNRLMVGTPDELACRIYFSGSDEDPTDTTVWDSLNFIDVPGDPQLQIRGLYTMRDYLLIVRRNGETWRLSGTPGVNDTLRRVSKEEPAFTAFQHARGVVTYDNQFWSVGLASTAPQTFNGGSWRPIDYLGTENAYADKPPEVWASLLSENDTIPPQYGATSPSLESILFAGEDAALLRRHNAWSKHEFDVTVVGWVAHHTNGAVILSDGGGASAKPNFYWWNTGDDRPPIDGSGVRSRDSVGDDSTTAPSCSFDTPEWNDQQGRRVILRGVIVIFDEYDTNVSQTNHFDIKAVSIDRYAATDETESAAQSYDAAPSSATADGVERRMEFGFGDQGLGEGCLVRVENLRGIKIKRLRLIVDVTEAVAV